jgi:high affinity Mn2+ porin
MHWGSHNRKMRWLLLAALLSILASASFAQEPPKGSSTAPPGVPAARTDAQESSSPSPPTADENSAPLTLFPHPESSRFWLSGQMNVILQWHPSFHSPYQGKQSLRPHAEHAFSRTLTLYSGAELSSSTELLFDFESVSGHGISEAFGLAGYTNLDVVRNPSLGGTPYIARAMFHAVFPLSSERVASTRSPLSLFNTLPARRLEFRVGRFSLVDFFDVNSAGSDSHLQFLNWTVDNNGAYDYAADTRGYSVGAMLDYEDRTWGVRFAEMLMPRVANGIDLHWNVTRARAENVEFELRHGLLPRRAGVIRIVSYVNHANMGDYRVAIDQFLAGQTPVPEITHHPLQETVKYGFGANLEQQVVPWLTAFGRFGWNEGRHESFAYTEVNQTVSFGAAAPGNLWHRKLDRVGLAFTSNALSGDHRHYLALGGCGFLLCDGKLNYGREKIVETFYTGHFWRGVYGSIGVQHINNPGYNRDRGPVLVPSIRLHLEL